MDQEKSLNHVGDVRKEHADGDSVLHIAHLLYDCNQQHGISIKCCTAEKALILSYGLEVTFSGSLITPWLLSTFKPYAKLFLSSP